ncbi:ATP-dependent DNA helicase DinG [Propionicimonas paludicola]|uniref:ATP-dependent DNA helicase DinG n=1 Tax=Propionicimonas paludicola TaxID=185243 RepID=A0A2A9CSI3_9ACTN|nr:ATP-dependent DNA helicase [Propionicimonas paludicola]PFG16572.1 ATP-dependent DNA helicase DinG [Propionicimonas paludicola]
MTDPDLTGQILAAAVEELGGQQRPGQVEMAAEVSTTFATGEHLLVQAGTGTGKSLGYLAPAVAELAGNPQARIVIATATLALQSQLANKDIPTAVAAAQQLTGTTVSHAVLKGRSNYVCLQRVRDGSGLEQDALVADPSEASGLGAEVVALRRWAEEEAEADGLADRDDAPDHTPAAWSQVSVPVRECLGAQKCPFGEVCFVEESRRRARASQLVVTNHALLAIDAMHGGTALPEYDALVIDEAHELVARVTGAASVELGPVQVERVAKRCLPWLADQTGLEFLDAADTLQEGLDEAEVGRIPGGEPAVLAAVRSVRDAARQAVTGLAGGAAEEVERNQAQAAAQEIFDIAERMAKLSEFDVIWVSESERFGRQLNCAPLSVAGLLRDRVFADHAVVLTSATLKLGGEFRAIAASVGLDATGADYRGVDVGSPFDYRSQGILYVATRLAPPTREGIAPDALAEIAELLWAAEGRTLGLFASQRAAEAAARYCRAEVPDRLILCQGDAHLPKLTAQFVADPEASLFGTLSLWQGLDVPGDTCRLVVIDKIPFPRPDDPLMQARQQAVTQAGGNGFMAVAASHAGLLLAQGAGRLIRTLDDRGVVAVLDPRLVTARYGSFLRASLPDFWMTTDPEVAVAALRRLGAAANDA